MNSTVTFILAGGQGSRLYPLTKNKVKPAVYVGGIFRLIDFSLSNCLHSQFRKVWVLTQYKSFDLHRHISGGWQIVSTAIGEFIEAVPPQQALGKEWYRGTADAIFQNLFLLEGEKPNYTLILSGDHVYKMDYRPFQDYHIKKSADLTIAVTRVPIEEASRFGVLELNEEGRIVQFLEKPENPPPSPDNPKEALVSMGIYFFNTNKLAFYTSKDARKANTSHDFGKDIIPAMLEAGENMYGYDYSNIDPYGKNGWWDVGTRDALFDLHKELINSDGKFNIMDPDWPIWSEFKNSRLPSYFMGSSKNKGPNIIENSFIAGQVTMDSCEVKDSLISPGVIIGEGTKITEAVIYPNVKIGKNCVIKKAIIDEGNIIADGSKIYADKLKPDWAISTDGVVVVPS